MKTSLAITTLSFLLLILATKPLIGNSAQESRADDGGKPVTDKYGNAVNTTIDYYLVPANDDVEKGGGISLITGRHGWPFDAILNPILGSHGNKVRFSLESDSSEIVHAQRDLNIIFTDIPEKPAFTVDTCDKNLKKWFITDGGVEGNPGAHTLLNWFQFVSHGGKNTYRIRHCPSVCSTCAVLCYYIGLFENGTCVKHLALVPDNQPSLTVQIVPAPCVCEYHKMDL